MTIYDHIKYTRDIKRYDGEIGLEIETETKKEYVPSEFKYWTTHRDGSLRDFGQEYVLRQPLKFKDELPVALEEFKEKTKDIKFIKDSISTSVHVHLNMMNETFKTMGNFLTVYSLVENLLIRYSGPDRLSNLFCLPMCDAEMTYRNICTMMNHISSKNYKGLYFNEGHNKYGALNLASFGTYGSLEVRSYRGTTDINEIYDWVGILYSIVEFARRDHNPKDIMDQWKVSGLKLLDNIFGQYREKLTHKDEEKLLKKNLLYAASTAYSVKDWNSLDVKKEEFVFKPTVKQLDNAAIEMVGKKYYDLAPGEADYVFESLRQRAKAKFFNTPKKELQGVNIPWQNIIIDDVPQPQVNLEEMIRPRRREVPLDELIGIAREVDGDF
jgi:hypothetical protein